MRSDRAIKHFILAFIIAIVGYGAAYETIEHLRNRRGAWRVSFECVPPAWPTLVVNQPALSITNVRLILAGQTTGSNHPASSLLFDRPRPVPFDVPFGRCVFMDTTFLPGTVTFELSDHEIELLPRVLVIDRRERPWVSGSTLTLGTPHLPAGR